MTPEERAKGRLHLKTKELKMKSTRMIQKTSFMW